MSGRQPGPVVCLSYLAAAELWQVERFPATNYGAEVLGIEQSVAADAPMAAAVLAALGVPVLLVANDLGDDAAGAEVRGWLQRFGVTTTARTAAAVSTPRIVVIADQQGSRTWFPHLPGVVGDLAAVDLSPVGVAPYAYIDCYELIESPAVRAIHAVRAAGVPLLLNLGGSPLSPGVCAAIRGLPRLVIQTNVDDGTAGQAPQFARSLLAATDAAWVVVTAGTAGAVALSARQALVAPAFRVSVRNTHCAGAAFSGGLLYGLLQDWPMEESLTLASASGALRCEHAHREPMPGLDELRAFMASHDRVGTPAA